MSGNSARRGSCQVETTMNKIDRGRPRASTAASHHLHEQGFYIILSPCHKRITGMFIICKIIHQSPSFTHRIVMNVFYFFKNKLHRRALLCVKALLYLGAL